MTPSETLKECAERLAHRPGDLEAISVLEQLLETTERAHAARYLAPAYERANNTAGLLNALGIIAETSVQPLEQLAWTFSFRKLRGDRGPTRASCKSPSGCRSERRA